MTALQRQLALTKPTLSPTLPEGEAIQEYSTAQIHRIQLDRGESPCFRSDERYTCRRDACPLGRECRRRIAAWQR